MRRSELVLVVAVMQEDLDAQPGGHHPSALSLSLCQASCCTKHFPEQVDQSTVGIAQGESRGALGPFGHSTRTCPRSSGSAPSYLHPTLAPHAGAGSMGRGCQALGRCPGSPRSHSITISPLFWKAKPGRKRAVKSAAWGGGDGTRLVSTA